MHAILGLSPDDQRFYCEQAQARLNLPPASFGAPRALLSEPRPKFP